MIIAPHLSLLGADCKTVSEAGTGSQGRAKLLRELFPDGAPTHIDELRFVFVCRAVLGVFLQVGDDFPRQLNSTEPVFAAGTVCVDHLRWTRCDKFTDLCNIVYRSARSHTSRTKELGGRRRTSTVSSRRCLQAVRWPQTRTQRSEGCTFVSGR